MLCGRNIKNAMGNKTYLKDPRLSPKVEVKHSPTHGKGMFALVSIKRDEIIAIWGGNFVTAEAAKEAREKGMAVQQINEDIFEIFDYGRRGEDPTYFHNHSCDPNTWMKDEVIIIARRDIKYGEELTIDYAMFVIDDKYVMPGECKCGSTLCRHIITGNDWRIKELQERYKGHFSPYLNEKIKR